MLENKDALLYSVIKINSNYYNGYSEIAETKFRDTNKHYKEA